MKKTTLFLTAVLAAVMLTVFAFAAETVVYVDPSVNASGNGTTPQTAYKTFAEGIKACASGGTVVVMNDVNFTAATQLATHTGKITVTSEYGGTDYGASINLSARIIMGGETEFDNINIKNVGATQRYIVARNHPLTIGEGVTTSSSNGGMMYPIIVGGRWNTAGTGNNSITVKSGTWQGIYGGNQTGKHTGTSVINFLGGEVLYAICGGSQLGSFEGNTTINIGGDAVVALHDTAGVIGASLGNGTTAYTFAGDIDINIYGNAVVKSKVLGVSCFDKVSVTGDVTIDIYGNAAMSHNIYGGGMYGNITSTNGIIVTAYENASFSNPSGSSCYICAGAQSGTVNGDTKVVIKDNVTITGNVCAGGNNCTVNGNSVAELYSGTVNVNFTAGTRIGTVNGNTTTVAYGGRIGFSPSGNFSLRGNGGYSSATQYGKVTGTAAVVLDGATVAGAATVGVGASGNVTLKSGSAGSAPDKSVIDLTGSKELSIGGDITASNVIGGGTLTLGSGSTLTTDTFSGNVELVISGTPEANHTYITVNDIDSTGVVEYTATSDEILTKTVGNGVIAYTVTYPERFETVKVHIDYYNPNGEGEIQPSLVLYSGLSSSDKRVKLSPTFGTENGKKYAEAFLEPGIYYYKVYYGSGGSDYHIKHFYVSGKAEFMNFDQPYEPYVADNYMEPYTATTTDEVLNNFLTVATLNNYTSLDTPTFTKHTASDRQFMTNDELCEYADALDAKCDYLYVYYPFAESAMGNKYPVLVFTKDAVPAGTSFDEIGEIVQSGGVREILMVSGGVHGNEPVGIEGSLAFANSLTGSYGETIMNSYGAIIVYPSVSADNAQRFKRLNLDGINPQRDLMQLTGEGTQNQVYVYKTFMPTVYIDCHTDTGTLTVSDSDYSVSYGGTNKLSHFDDAVIRYASVFNSPIIDINGIADGTAPVSEQLGQKIALDSIDSLIEDGFRSALYYFPNAKPNTSWVYAQARGSYGFLIESMRIWSGKDRYERSVFSMQTAIQTIASEVASYEGELAQNVYNGRNAAVITEFDENNIFAKNTTASGDLKYTFERPSIFLDGTVKGTDIVTFTHHDTVSDFIAMPTAYVIPADEADIETVLELLDMHGIKYTKLRDGATLTLRKYSGLDTVNSGNEAVTIGAAEEVTFENGAYAVTLDTSDSYFITYLFEPDSFPYTSAAEHMHSLTNMGYITGDDALYRSETDDVSAIIEALSKTAEFAASADAGYYAESAEALEQTGTISLNASIENYSECKDVIEAFGIYVYNVTTNEKVTLESGKLDELLSANGEFYALVTNIDKQNFEKNILFVPYVVMGGNVLTGESMTVNVATYNKWLGAK